MTYSLQAGLDGSYALRRRPIQAYAWLRHWLTRGNQLQLLAPPKLKSASAHLAVGALVEMLGDCDGYW